MAHYTRRLTDTQRRYTAEEHRTSEYSINIKKIKGMLLDYTVVVHTDHLNLVYETIVKASDRVMR